MAAPILITNATIHTPGGTIPRGWVRCEGGRIAEIGTDDAPPGITETVYDAQGRHLLPGFIDLHVHGSAGHDTMDASADGLWAMARFFAQHGVTGFLPTTLTANREQTYAALQTIKTVRDGGPISDGAAVLGAHLEGPYLNPGKSGAQNLEQIRRADRDEALPFLDLDVIKLLALAPEYEENHWLIEECAERGITVSAAHTDATYEQVMAAVDLGLRHATHTYNAMSGLHHRRPGTVGAVMASPQILCELIADNFHVHPGAMRVLWLAKGEDGLILITDAMAAAGMPEGDYRLGEYAVTVRDGQAMMDDGTMAGSIATYDRVVANFMAATGEPFERIWKCVSLNAARAIGLDSRKGSIESGKDADLVLVDEQVNVALTVVGGQIVYDTSTAH
jgi:N-acetylglucosamine-6-phosphate deacetylase